MTYILPKDLEAKINSSARDPLTLEGVSTTCESFVIADLWEQHPSEDILFVARDESALTELAEHLPYLLPQVSILKLPAWDCLPYDRVSPRKDIIGARVQTLSTLANRAPKERYIILTTPSAFLQKVTPKSEFLSKTLDIKVGQETPVEDLISHLSTQGYYRVSNVREPGEFAVRGGIFDVFPSGQENPYRLDFFGDTIESLRTFDPLTQRSLEDQKGLSLAPMGELCLTPQTTERFRTNYRSLFADKTRGDLLYQDISEGRYHPGMEHWLPLFYETLDHLTAYLNKPFIAFTHGIQEAFSHRFEQIQDHYGARLEGVGKEMDPSLRYNPLQPSDLYLSQPDIEGLEKSYPTLYTSAFKTGDNPTVSLSLLPALAGESVPKVELLKQFLQTKQKENRIMHVACQSQGSRHQFISQLQDLDFLKLTAVDSWKDGQNQPRKIVRFHIFGLQQGFETEDFTLITEREIFGEIQRKIPKKARRSDLFIAEASALELGDYVVHEEHGIGQFDGLHTLSISDIPHDCVKLLYHGGDKLFLPVENIELISRYGGESSNAILDRLGAIAWQARRAKVKKRLEEIADHLISVAALRQIKTAPRFQADSGLYGEFSHRFLFTETNDQLRAIEDVLGDLASGKPMDRLICGDVGFGKTEVALRAAFVVAATGKQVAIVAPTTLLARQHYQNFLKRFDNFGLSVGQLSRLVTGKQATQVKEDLKSGRLNIVIGTHALLAKTIAFKDLGLVIVDEEQHFGVKQKERLKDLQKDIHVLTLTATPIPRTLQMALTGVRDMSIIATPPVDRLTIRTFITPFDPMVVEEALHRELNRGGQVFYVCPRIKDLDDVLKNLIKIDSSLKIAVAHGQMPVKELEQVMDDFAAHKYDILLSTNIIESGIDLPTVNTLFIHRSDLFGLSQLYQLRGRVGRSKTRAYAYLTIPTQQLLSKNALRRLEVMQTLDTLGAGFQLASHDMDIRGAGNLLGQEQSGHVREVGVELYQHMLEEAVEKARHAAQDDQEDPTTEGWSPQLNLGVAVLLPEEYVADLSVRLELYRRLAHLENQDEIDDFIKELVDRFGPYPAEVDNLLRIISLKQLAKKARVSKVDVGQKGVVIKFHKDTFEHPEKLLQFIQDQRGLAKIRPDQSLFFTRNWNTIPERFKGCSKLLEEIGAL